MGFKSQRRNWPPDLTWASTAFASDQIPDWTAGEYRRNHQNCRARRASARREEHHRSGGHPDLPGATLPIVDMERARKFYEETLGLKTKDPIDLKLGEPFPPFPAELPRTHTHH